VEEFSLSLQVYFEGTPQPRNVTFWQSVPALENQFQYRSVRTGLIRAGKMKVPTRVQGLPIRDCARGCINPGYMWLQLSAMYVTEKTFFERLYLVLGLRQIAP